MMNLSQKVEELENLTIKKLKEKIKSIKKELPREEQKVITFSKNFTLSLSNYCQNQCAYCFYNQTIPKENNEQNIVLIRKDKIHELIQTATIYGCTEALLMSGEAPDNFKVVQNELKKRNYRDFFQFVRKLGELLLNANLLPHTNIGVLSFAQLKSLKEVNASMGLMIESTCESLSNPGGVHENSLSKTPESRIEHITNAGKLKIPFTTGLLLGIGENFQDRVKDLLLIKELHRKYGHIQEVIIQNFTEKIGINYRPIKPITIEETLKIAGIAKIILGNDIAIQIPPNLIQNYEKEAIEMGINDFGGISPFTLDYINPKHAWPKIDYLDKICESNGYKLMERLPIYKKYINKKGFYSEKIKKTINSINQDAGSKANS
ncbi:MAG: 7,8-didemethyl-8-hydroxy-5-deazariboflavin synthase subunit CofG [Candidatus Lokiarchaeota archaeon]|nr:7,8-didemethyl-8-hydroxy-5-deazariboflavin synthase subunit CofG [Candidatus Lokiarchaeota archaeon]